jgi:hypothetical protein
MNPGKGLRNQKMKLFLVPETFSAPLFEPKGWFDNRPILKPKIGVVAQDRVRGLRRELAQAKSRNRPGGRNAPGAGGG